MFLSSRIIVWKIDYVSVPNLHVGKTELCVTVLGRKIQSSPLGEAEDRKGCCSTRSLFSSQWTNYLTVTPCSCRLLGKPFCLWYLSPYHHGSVTILMPILRPLREGGCVTICRNLLDFNIVFRRPVPMANDLNC
jgi:hypothetical protein